MKNLKFESMDYNTFQKIDVEFLKKLLEYDIKLDIASIKYLIQKGKVKHLRVLESVGYTLPEDALGIAISYGKLKTVKYLFKRDPPKTDKFWSEKIKAGEKGYEDVLRFLIVKGMEIPQPAIDDMAGLNKLDFIRYIYSIGLKCVDGIRYACLNGHLEMLKLIESLNDVNLQCNDVFKNAIESNNIDVISWVIEQGFPVDENAINIAIQNKNYELVKVLYAKESEIREFYNNYRYRNDSSLPTSFAKLDFDVLHKHIHNRREPSKINNKTFEMIKWVIDNKKDSLKTDNSRWWLQDAIKWNIMEYFQYWYEYRKQQISVDCLEDYIKTSLFYDRIEIFKILYSDYVKKVDNPSCFTYDTTNEEIINFIRDKFLGRQEELEKEKLEKYEKEKLEQEEIVKMRALNYDPVPSGFVIRDKIYK